MAADPDFTDDSSLDVPGSVEPYAATGFTVAGSPSNSVLGPIQVLQRALDTAQQRDRTRITP